MDIPISPLAPTTIPKLPTIPGVDILTAQSGEKYKDRDDVLIMRFPEGTVMAGVYSQNKCPGAPIEWNRTLTPGPIDTLVVNAGNANVFTGHAGIKSVEMMAQTAPGNRVTISSTGVIGEPMNDRRMELALQNANGDKDWIDAANAIKTTDTFAKAATVRFTTARDETVIINGIAKGSGMIAPDMATMLAYLVTNAKLSPNQAQALLSDACQQSFNSISVDSDQSTSDTLQFFATGSIELNDHDFGQLKALLKKLCAHLAELIIRDGEGASKLIQISVFEAENENAAKRIALAIANSPLVKTAISGNDANWGRVVMAVGKAGEQANRDKLWIKFGNILVAENGMRHSNYSEVSATQEVHKDHVTIEVGVGIGPKEHSATVLTCDLTHGYININGDYRS